MTDHPTRTMTAGRKWQMIRLPRTGDWLLPSNNTAFTFRISKYIEDGSAERVGHDGKWHSVYGNYWEVAYTSTPALARAIEHAVDIEDALSSVRWTPFGTAYPTRQSAIDDAIAWKPGSATITGPDAAESTTESPAP